jgi:SPP1 gp7 family putative phage head morphogenesis protein
MQHNLRDFLRHGGDGQYVVTKQNGTVYGYRAAISIKSLFPGYADLRAGFSNQLDSVIADNTRMLLNALTPPDNVPWVTEADLRDVSDAKEEALRQWDARLTAIFDEYQTHPQRLRPLRTAMEERLLRAFAGLINQLRQLDLGIEKYIWRSRDDSKVRDSHAGFDDQVFRWDQPPAGGHPGQAHNCRCVAEPVALGSRNDVILVELTLPADSFPSSGGIVRGLANGLLARSPAGIAAYAALEANNLLQGFVQSAREQRVRDAATILGADLGTIEGLLAAQSYAQALALAENGFLSGSPERGDRARVIAEAIGLYEMYRPGLFTLPNENALDAVNLARRLAAEALAALDAGRLVIEEGSLSQGWVEVFPELTEDERRLGQLPGFTPERIDQWLETYPAEVLGLPNHTGSPPVEDPTGNIISTPIPDEAGPNIVEARPGEPTPISPNDDDATRRAIRRENESAQLLAGSGFNVLQNPVVAGPKKPDYLINGEVYDHYAPSTDVARNIWSEVQGKVQRKRFLAPTFPIFA